MKFIILLKNENSTEKFEDLIVFIKQFINQVASHPVEGCSKELYEVEGFYRKEGGARVIKKRK